MNVATKLSESLTVSTYQFLPMLYLVVFSNIGLADYEKSAKASQTIGLVDNTMITVVRHRYQAMN